MTTPFAHAPATIRLGDLEVVRLGYGAMRLPGPDVWGEPADRPGAIAVVRRAVELGINFIDTSWFYGPHVANRILKDALHPYPKGLVIATKLGGKRLPDKSWTAFARPEEIRKGLEEDLGSLGLERVDVVHLRFMPSSGVPLLESLGALVDLQKEGKVRHIALSNVSAKLLEQALAVVPIVAVQNMYGMAGGDGEMAKMAHALVEEPEKVLEVCTARKIAFLPFFPVLSVSKPDPEHERVAKKYGVSKAQIGIAWLLARSPVILPIPGTSSIAHLEENWAARTIPLTHDEVATLARSARKTSGSSQGGQ
jgi:aryl-alcohol dehydrogenase-like predicted oxidoreductase